MRTPNMLKQFLSSDSLLLVFFIYNKTQMTNVILAFLNTCIFLLLLLSCLCSFTFSFHHLLQFLCIGFFFVCLCTLSPLCHDDDVLFKKNFSHKITPVDLLDKNQHMQP